MQINFDILKQIYDTVDQEALKFQNITENKCPEGCGRCCSKQYTQRMKIFPIEMEYIFYYLQQNKDLYNLIKNKLEEKTGYCIFYNFTSNNHCLIYSVRPLICRSYGFIPKRLCQITFSEKMLKNEISDANNVDLFGDFYQILEEFYKYDMTEKLQEFYEKN